MQANHRQSAQRGHTALYAAIGVVLLSILGGGSYFLFFKRSFFTAQPSSFAWTRTQQVEELKPVQKTGESPPAGATILKREEKGGYEEIPHKVEEFPCDLFDSLPENYYLSLQSLPEQDFQSGDFWIYKEKPYDESQGMHVVDVYDAIWNEVTKGYDQSFLEQEQYPCSFQGQLPRNFYKTPEDASKREYESGEFWTYDLKSFDAARGIHLVDVYDPQWKVRTIFTYTVDEWTRVQPLTLSGTDQSPHWPEIETSATRRAVPNGRTQSLKVYLTGDGKSITWEERDEGRFIQYQLGRDYQMSTTKAGSLRME